jgi:hypothetical protein
MNAVTRVGLIGTLSILAACASANRPKQWFDHDRTPAGRYQEAKFVDSDDLAIQQLLVRLEKLEASMNDAGRNGDRSENEAKKIIWTLSKELTRKGQTRICEHILWKLSTRADSASMHEIYLLDFLSRCQDLVFEYGGDDEAPYIETSAGYLINASSRASFLKILVAKAQIALQRLQAGVGAMYADVACEVLERVNWGAVNRINRVQDTESPAFKSSAMEALRRYRDRLGA